MVGTTSIGAQLDRNWRIRSLLKTDQHLDRIAAPEISGPFLHWVDAHPGRPFFAFLNYYDAHGPYLPPHPWDRKFSAGGRKNDLSPLHRFFAGPRRELPDSAVIQAEIDQYDGALAYLDDQLGRLFAELAKRGILDHTVVLIAADHGEEFGEHGVFDHGNSLYRPAVQVPLVIRFPGQVPAGVVVDSAVTLRDVAATLADLAGLGPAGQLPGQTLARFWRKEAPIGPITQSPILSEVSKGIRTPPWYPVSRGDMRSLVGFGYRYILGGDGTEQLFKLDDVREQTPLADSTARLAAFRQQLTLWPWVSHGAGWTGVP
jgi:arylsulfatase A-like enzyme